MSASVRTPLSATQGQNSTADMLKDIIAHYRPFYGSEDMVLYRVQLYERVSDELWQRSQASRAWGWRYILSVENGTLAPSRFVVDAIEKLYAELQDTPEPIPVEPCPRCHHAPTVCLCDGKQVRAPYGSGEPATRPRRAIYLDDAESAAASIIGANPSGEYLQRLSELLDLKAS